MFIWGDIVERISKIDANDNAIDQAIIEIKLAVNRRLFDKGILTEEMYTRAKELILKGSTY